MNEARAPYRVGVDVGGTFKNSNFRIFSACADMDRQVVVCQPYLIEN